MVSINRPVYLNQPVHLVQVHALFDAVVAVAAVVDAVAAERHHALHRKMDARPSA